MSNRDGILDSHPSERVKMPPEPTIPTPPSISKRVSKKVLLVQTVNVCHRYGSRIIMFAKLCAPPLGPRPFDFAQGDGGTD